MPDPLPITVAHAYGNSRERIDEAIAAGVELIEADLRYRHGRIDIRHDYRLPIVPVLYNRGLRGIHKEWPWSVSIGSNMIRLDTPRWQLAGLLAYASGRGSLMLDLKRDTYSEDAAQAFVAATAEAIEVGAFAGRIEFCGFWPLLDRMRERLPSAIVRYSVDTPHDWQRFVERLDGPDPIASVTIQRDLLTHQRAQVMRDARVSFLAWDIETAAEADHALAMGATGVIADDLAMLAALRHQPVRPGGS